MTHTNQTHGYCVCKKYDDGYDDYYNNEYSYVEMGYGIIQQMFPNAKFNVSILLQDMEKTISDLDKIIVKQTFVCYCYDGYEPVLPAKWFPIHCSFEKGEKMTNKFVINELIKQGLVLDCNHHYLEGFFLSSNNTTCQFEMFLGS